MKIPGDTETDGWSIVFTTTTGKNTRTHSALRTNPNALHQNGMNPTAPLAMHNMPTPTVAGKAGGMGSFRNAVIRNMNHGIRNICNAPKKNRKAWVTMG